MRIGIDCRMYGPKQAGLGRYVQQLVLGLQKNDQENEYVLFVKKDNPLLTSPLAGGGKFRLVEADIPWYGWKEQIKFKKIIKNEKVDLMHFPHWNVPLLYNDSFVVTIHDLIMYHYPREAASTHGPVIYWLKDLAHRVALRHAVKKAKQLIVTSEFTKHDVHETLKVPLEKMRVIYQAPFESDQKQDTNKFQISNFTGKFQIDRPYVLYVGNAYPHKNLDGLIGAWKIFVEKYSDKYQLVLCGRRNFFYNKLITTSLHHDITTSRQSDKGTICQSNSVVFTDYVTDIELSQLYSNASLFVFPSLYEGFGLPPLEALSYGIPVASSNASCLPEVLGEGAIYFDPENYEQLAEVLYRGLTDENLRHELRLKGAEELKKYLGNEFVNRTMMIYINI